MCSLLIKTVEYLCQALCFDAVRRLPSTVKNIGNSFGDLNNRTSLLNIMSGSAMSELRLYLQDGQKCVSCHRNGCSALTLRDHLVSIDS
jgi:hypothetical protein